MGAAAGVVVVAAAVCAAAVECEAAVDEAAAAEGRQATLRKRQAFGKSTLRQTLSRGDYSSQLAI